MRIRHPKFRITITGFAPGRKSEVAAGIVRATHCDPEVADRFCASLPITIPVLDKESAYTLVKELEHVADMTWIELNGPSD
jgi:hypothetical protein